MLAPRQSSEAKCVLTIFRAAALSRKQPATAHQLLRDYTELEGHGVNYRKFGYEHLEDFLVQSGEFIVHNMQGEMYLTARPSPETDHIRKLMRGQKKLKKQSTSKFREPAKSDQSWNKSSFASNVSQKLSSPRKHSKHSPEKNNNAQRKSGDSNNNSNQSNRNASQKTKNSSPTTASLAASKSHHHHQQQQQQHQHQSTKTKSTSNSTSKSATSSLQDRLKQSQQSQQQTLKDSNKIQQPQQLQQQQQQKVPNNTQNGEKQQQQQGGKSSLVNQHHVQQQQTTNKLQQRISVTINNSANTQQQQLERERRFSDESILRISPIVKPISKGSIQDRLKFVQQQSNPSRRNSANDDMQRFSPSSSPNSLVRNNSNSVIVNEPEKTKNTTKNIPATITPSTPPTPPITTAVPPLVFEFNPDLDSITSLAQYCAVRRYEQPIYKFLRSRFTPKIHGRVIVNGATYSTYPDEFDSDLHAKLAAATRAIDEIKIQETRHRYPVCMDSDSEIALKIYEEVKQHSFGIFHRKIPEIFEYKYQKTLPDNWFSIIQESNMFTIEMTLDDNMIILVREETAGSSAASVNSDSLDSDVIIIDRILLPWENKYWNLYITYCTSTIEIWARIVGKDYNDKLDSLQNDIDVYMLTDKQRPTSIICGQIYLISISECWHRVRVEEMNKENGKCLCFFIDFGDEEWQSMEQLYICETNFLKLPPQAICFSLFGLEDFAENPNAKKHLDTLTGRSLVAEILTKKETFENDSVDGSMHNLNNTKIQCVLYDTSTYEDVNLNPLILNQICNDTQPPELKRNVVNNVYITHVQRNGDIYLQIRSMELQYVQKLVQQLVESKFKKDQHKVSNEDVKTTKLFFIQDPDDGRWYRGALTTEQSDCIINLSSGGVGVASNSGRIQNSDGTYNIFYVDYGVIKRIPLSRIYRLDSLSAALSKFPRQAIKVRLHKLPQINDMVIGLIRGLLPAETPAIVKIAVNAIIPQVIVYKRFEDKGGLFNVNESIQIEYELERSNEVCDIQSTATSTIGNAVGKVGRESPIQSYSTFDITGSGLGPHSPINSMRASLLRTQITVPNSPQKDLPKLLENIFVPGIGELFNVIVTMASNPSNFTVRPYNDGPKLAEMMEELKVYCSSNDEFIPGDMIEQGQAYAAYNSDGYYYRVTVENIFKSMEIHVHYCDFGGVAVLSNDKLKTLPAKFRTLPKQAIAAKLSDVKPIHGDWTLQDCIRFQQLTVKQKFVSIIKNITDDPVTPGTRLLELTLVDVQTDEDIYIDDIMINEGRAIKCL